MRNCDKCGHKLEMHYVLFCPKCDTDALKIKPNVIGDLFKIMYHMEANGFMSKDDFWGNYFTEAYYFSNDSYVDVYLEDCYKDEELNKYMRKVAELLGVNIGEEITMWVSW